MEQLDLLHGQGETKRTARVLAFPAPGTRVRDDRPGRTIGEPPAQVRQLSERQVEHRRRMLIHLASAQR